jgi:hypothetical protein
MSSPIRAVPFGEWPTHSVTLKKCAWDSKSSLHNGSGLAHHWRKRTNRGAEQALGLWLDFLIRHDLPWQGLTPIETVTRLALELYIQELQTRETIGSDWTIRNYIRDLGEAIRVMQPDAYRSLLKEAWSELEALCDPVIDPVVSQVGASDLFDAGIERMKKFRIKAFDHWRPALAYGDGLMMSMWICKSIRASTFACTQTGINLLLANGHYRVHYEVYQNKTKVVIDAGIAPELNEYIEEWDAIKHAALEIKCVGNGINRISENQSVRPLWATRTGQQMSGR